jgi:hypothetical protein
MKQENILFKISPALEQNTQLFEPAPSIATRKGKGPELAAHLLRFLVVAALLWAVLATGLSKGITG